MRQLVFILLIASTTYGQADPKIDYVRLGSLASVENGQEDRNSRDFGSSFRDRGKSLGSLRRTAARLQAHDGLTPSGSLEREGVDWYRKARSEWVSTRSSTPQVVDIQPTDTNYMIFFTIDGCGGCNAMKPRIQQLQDQRYKIYIANAKWNSELVQQYKVSKYPTTVIFNKKQVIKTYVGMVKIEAITKYLQKIKTPNYDFTNKTTIYRLW
jgi:thiol-disulfide isomerase/thioredoxin